MFYPQYQQPYEAAPILIPPDLGKIYEALPLDAKKEVAKNVRQYLEQVSKDYQKKEVEKTA